MNPPFSLTPATLKWNSEISRLCGQIESWNRPVPKPELRRKSRIQSIQGSLAIEGNTLSLEQVTALLDGKRVAGPKRDILEASNARKAYDAIDRYGVYSAESLLKAHRVMMDGLVDAPGEWRRGNVGIQKGKSIAHPASPPGIFRAAYFSRLEYLKAVKTISPATASRDVRDGAASGILLKKGKGNRTRYGFNPKRRW
ncbi:MAG TPA: hypothetical protein VJ385_19985 [Fibrobacteria bacterium]|nr:hypothetical protein [Fibrobacteria bacterium]